MKTIQHFIFISIFGNNNDMMSKLVFFRSSGSMPWMWYSTT